MNAPGTVYVVGPTLYAADDFLQSRGCARRPWGWTELETGRRLRFLHRPDDLRGREKGLTVYCVPGYRDRRDWREFDAILENRKAVRVLFP